MILCMHNVGSQYGISASGYNVCGEGVFLLFVVLELTQEHKIDVVVMNLLRWSVCVWTESNNRVGVR